MSTAHRPGVSQAAKLAHEFPELPLDRYKIIQHIGKGAFSRVYLAYTPEYKRRAIKRLRLTAKPHQILREIQFLRMLEGKENVVQIKEIRFSMNTLQTSVITNFCDSDDFKAVIFELTPRDIQNYMRALLISLAHVERANMLHRDVKPGNFLFSKNTGKALLIDFGLAQTLREAREFPILRSRSRRRVPLGRPVMRDLRMAGFVNKELARLRPLAPQPHSGTHGYRAPEILVSVNSQDMRIDTWSAGVILLQMITGKTGIFRGESNTDLYELMAIRAIHGTDRFTQGMGQLGADYSLTAGAPMPQRISLQELTCQYNQDLFAVLPPSAYDLCLRLLAFAPQNRLSAAEALNHPFICAKPEDVPDHRCLAAFDENPFVVPVEEIEKGTGNEMQHAFEVASRAAIPRETAQNLTEEYNISTPAYELQPLPKETRAFIDAVVARWKMGESQTEWPGPHIIRPSPSDYQMPSTCAIVNLSKTRGAILVNPQIVSTPGFSIGPTAEAREIERRVSERQGTMSTPEMRTHAMEEIWGFLNSEKESWEIMQRMTSLRRRLDPWIQPLKALDRELRYIQEEARLAAEDYRFALIEQGFLDVSNPKAQEIALQGIVQMQRRLGFASRPVANWVKEGIRRMSLSPRHFEADEPPQVVVPKPNTTLHLPECISSARSSRSSSPIFNRLPPTISITPPPPSLAQLYRNHSLPQEFTLYDLSRVKLAKKLFLRLQCVRPRSLFTPFMTSFLWHQTAELSIKRRQIHASTRAQSTKLMKLTGELERNKWLTLRGLSGVWHQAPPAAASGQSPSVPDLEPWDESVTTDGDSATDEVYSPSVAPTPEVSGNPLHNIQKSHKKLKRREKRRKVVRRAEEVAFIQAPSSIYPQVEAPSALLVSSSNSEPPRAQPDDAAALRRRHSAALPKNISKKAMRKLISFEVLRIRSTKSLHQCLLFSSVKPIPDPAPGALAAPAPITPADIRSLDVYQQIRAAKSTRLEKNRAHKAFFTLLNEPSTRFLVSFRLLAQGVIPPSLEGAYPIGVQMALKSCTDPHEKRRLKQRCAGFSSAAKEYLTSALGSRDVVEALKVVQQELDAAAQRNVTGASNHRGGHFARSPDLAQMLGLPRGILSSVVVPTEGRSTSRSRPSRILADPSRVKKRYPHVAQMIQAFVEETTLQSTAVPRFIVDIKASFARAQDSIKSRRLFRNLCVLWARNERELAVLRSVEAARLAVGPGARRAALVVRARRRRQLSALFVAFRRFGGALLCAALRSVRDPCAALSGAGTQLRDTEARAAAVSASSSAAAHRARLAAPTPPPRARRPWPAWFATTADIHRVASHRRRRLSPPRAARVLNSARLRRELLRRTRLSPARVLHGRAAAH